MATTAEGVPEATVIAATAGSLAGVATARGVRATVKATALVVATSPTTVVATTETAGDEGEEEAVVVEVVVEGVIIHPEIRFIG